MNEKRKEPRVQESEDTTAQTSESQGSEEYLYPAISRSIFCSTQEDCKEPDKKETENKKESMESILPLFCIDPCIICQSRPTNGCIVHDKIGHHISCFTCARKLKKWNKPYPVCR